MKKWLYAAAAVLSRRSRDKAMKAGRKADVLQADAERAAEVGQAAIDKVGSNDETMRDLLDNWRSDRVQ